MTGDPSSWSDSEPLPAAFYLQPTVDAARALVGQLLLRVYEGDVLVGRIVETEAYPSEDPANHAFRGKTARNAAMFGPPGRAYVYRIYGMHLCLNLVTAPEGYGEAVLIRAVEPVQGLDRMRTLRPVEKLELLTSGPARLCQAFGIDLDFNNEDMIAGHRLRVAPGPGPLAPVEARTRIGIAQAAAAGHPWRFVERGNRFLSRR